MKKIITLLSILMITGSAFAISDKELTAKTILDEKFVGPAESAMKSIFKDPESVRLDFHSASVEVKDYPNFQVRYEYHVYLLERPYGLCSFIFNGIIQADENIKYAGPHRFDCGD